MKDYKMLIMAVMLTAATAALSFGQQAPVPAPAAQLENEKGPARPGPRKRDGAVTDKKHEEVKKKLDAVRIWKLTEQLKLDAETSAKVSSLLSSLDLKRKDLQREHVATIKSLRQSIDAAKPDQAKIKTHLDNLEKNQQAVQDLKEKEMNGLKALLTVEQQARYALFHQDFRREMRGMIENARGSGKGPREAGGPGKRERKQKDPERQADK